MLPGVQALTGDVTAPDSLRFPAGLDYVFVLLAPGESGEEAYRRVYYEGTRHVLAALAGQSLKRLFWISSSSVYAQDDGSRVDEDSLAEPVSATARILRDSEELARGGPWPVTVVRLSGLYGNGRLRLLKWVEAGRPMRAEPPQWTNRLHVDDAAGLLAFLLERDLAGIALAEIYLGTDNEPAPQHEVLDWLADRLGLPWLPREAGPAGEGLNKRLDNSRLLALGYRLRHPDYRAGYSDVLAKYQ